MKSAKYFLFLFTSILFTQCDLLIDKCGDNVDLGSYELTTQSKTDWFPYLDVNEVSFKNGAGEEITLQIQENEEVMMYTPLAQICNEGFGDVSEEFIRCEWIYKTYTCVHNTISYKLEIALYIDLAGQNANSFETILYDKISYSSVAYPDNDVSSGVGGFVDLIANDRGNAIDFESTNLVPSEFSEEIEINGQTYQNVWYFNREWPASVFTPGIYVQKGNGIIAFLGMNEEVWVLQY